MYSYRKQSNTCCLKKEKNNLFEGTAPCSRTTSMFIMGNYLISMYFLIDENRLDVKQKVTQVTVLSCWKKIV